MCRQGVFITELEPKRRGPRLAIKDLFDTAGIRTTYGSRIFEDHVPNATASAVSRLEAAGYVAVGKTNLHEFAWGVTSENEHYGPVPNPLAPGRIAGGSSGGSAAAVAAGLADVALGTDSGGSIRIPAACCGTAGFKPTFGLVPVDRCFPLAPSFDHAGPIASDVAGCERLMTALAPEFEPRKLTSLAELTVAVAWVDHADRFVARRVERASRLFPVVRSLNVPLPHRNDTAALFGREAAEVHAILWRDHRDLYGQNVALKIESAMRLTDREVEKASRARVVYREQFAELMEQVDLLVTPTLPMVAPPAGRDEREIRGRMLQFTYPANVVGAPALAIPCGRAEHGLPASLQLIGRPGEDGLVLAAGRFLEQQLATVKRVRPRPLPTRGAVNARPCET